MDKDEAIKKAIEYSKLVGTYLKPKQILLYGSYARGNWNRDSDIDIAVVVEAIGDGYLEQASALYRLRRNIDDRIEPVLLAEDDDPSGFLKEIRRHGEVIYSE